MIRENLSQKNFFLSFFLFNDFVDYRSFYAHLHLVVPINPPPFSNNQFVCPLRNLRLTKRLRIFVHNHEFFALSLSLLLLSLEKARER